MQLEPIGFLPKDTTIPTGWSQAAGGVTEICSVSDCVNSSPLGWIDKWLHNDLGFFNSVAAARSVIVEGPQRFTVFAFRLLDLRFVRGKREPVVFSRLPVEPIPPDFVPLGFDIVSKTISSQFECSPLSCNGMANEVPVNTYCLVRTLDEAIAVAERFSLEEPEPGPYHVLEVLREPAQFKNPGA